jgi:hypothetical protein
MMSLKPKLNNLLASGKLGAAIDLLMEHTKNTDTDSYNSLILLKARHSANERDNTLGIVSRSDYTRTNAQLIHAFQQVMENVPELIMENNLQPNQNQKMGNLPTEKEIDGYQQLLNLLIDKRMFFETEKARAYDSEKKFALAQEINELERQINDLKQKVSGDLNTVNNQVNMGNNSTGNYIFQGMSGGTVNLEIKNGLVSMESKLEKEIEHLKALVKDLQTEKAVSTKKQVLFICSSPTGKNPLDFGKELSKIKTALQQADLRDTFNIEIETSVRADDLLRILSRKPYPHIVHISMHSSKSEGLYFEDTNGDEFPMSVANFQKIFQLISTKHKPEAVILSACNSWQHGQAVKGCAKHVIATNDFFPDKIAILYANKFYEMIFNGEDIPYAHQAAVLSIELAPVPPEDRERVKTPLHEIPVLLS